MHRNLLKTKNNLFEGNPEQIHEYYLNILNNLPYNVYWMDANSVYLGANKTSSEFMGLSSPNEVYGKTYEDFEKLGAFEKWQGDSFKKDDIEVLTTGKPKFNVEEPPIRNKNGEFTNYVTTRVPLFKQEGKIIGLVGISVDITERKKMEEQLRLAKEQSEHLKEAEIELRKAVMILAGSMVHDLRDSITIIALASSNLRDILNKIDQEAVAPELVERAKSILKCVGFIEDANHTMNNFVNDSLKTLKNVLKKEVSKEDLSVCSMWHCIHNTLFRYPFLDEQRKLVKWDQRDFNFKGNELVMIRVVSNLLGNSLQQIHKNGGGEVLITTSETEDANFLYFKDTAGGAAAEVVEHLFDGYKTTKQEGTGIGLAFCKMALENFGAKLSCRSELGKYIEFILEFPKVTQNLSDL